MSINDILRRAEDTQREIREREGQRQRDEYDRLSALRDRAAQLLGNPKPIGCEVIRRSHDLLPGSRLYVLHHPYIIGSLQEQDADLDPSVLSKLLAEQLDKGVIELLGVRVSAWLWREVPKPSWADPKSSWADPKRPWPKLWLHVVLDDARFRAVVPASALRHFWVPSKVEHSEKENVIVDVGRAR